MSAVTDAVFFFNDGDIARQMLQAEFEALLDGVVQAPELSSQRVQAVYLQIDQHLNIKSLVFFLISFEKGGEVEAQWNVPLNQLLQSAGQGPNLGSGVTKVVTQEQCSLTWQKANLWTPDVTIFPLLVKAVKQNQLGIITDDEAWLDSANEAVPTVMETVAEPPILSLDDDIPVLEPVPVRATQEMASLAAVSIGNTITQQDVDAIKQAYTIKVEKLNKDIAKIKQDAEKSKQTNRKLKEQSEQLVNSIKTQAKERVDQLKLDFKEELAQKNQQIESLRLQIENEQNRYSQLKEQQVEQAASYQAEREDLLEKLEEGQALEGLDIEELKSAFAKELVARVEAETTVVQEQLAMREVEVFYREEQIALAEAQVQRLKQEKQQLLSGTGNKILRSMDENGITFVAFHVGVGHITLPVEDIGRYIDQRNAYLAEFCKISEDDFAAWRKHYQTPTCQHQHSDGSTCNEPVARVDWAASFEQGISDRCSKHR